MKGKFPMWKEGHPGGWWNGPGRDPRRIPVILAELSLLWEKYPDLRLVQLINLATKPADFSELFNLEDDLLYHAIVEKNVTHK